VSISGGAIHLQGGARGKALPAPDDHSSGSATNKQTLAAPGGGQSIELANIHNLNFVTEVKGERRAFFSSTRRTFTLPFLENKQTNKTKRVFWLSFHSG
jgi:hypothetical protein